MILLYTTHSSREAAEKITKLLLEQKLIACVNYFPIEACLVWNKERTTENEIVALYKTSNEKWKATETEILTNHPYEVPCIIKIEASANAAYENWINAETTDS
jgi:periplasmic divalent cation tolerance protein